MEGTGSISGHLSNISSAPTQHTLIRISSQSNEANSGQIPSSLYSRLTVASERRSAPRSSFLWGITKMGGWRPWRIQRECVCETYSNKIER